MAANRDRFNRFSATDPPRWKPGTFVRKGVVGDHRRELTGAQADRILVAAEAHLEPGCPGFVRAAR